MQGPKRVFHIADEINVVIIVASIGHHDFLAVRGPLGVQICLVPSGQPPQPMVCKIHQIDIPMTRATRYKNQVIVDRGPMGKAVLCRMPGESLRLVAADGTEVEIVVSAATIAHDYKAISPRGPTEP